MKDSGRYVLSILPAIRGSSYKCRRNISDDRPQLCKNSRSYKPQLLLTPNIFSESQQKSNFYSSVTVNLKSKVMIHHREIKCEPRRVIPTIQNVRLLTSVIRVLNPCGRYKRTPAHCVRCLSPKTNSTLKFAWHPVCLLVH